MWKFAKNSSQIKCKLETVRKFGVRFGERLDLWNIFAELSVSVKTLFGWNPVRLITKFGKVINVARKHVGNVMKKLTKIKIMFVQWGEQNVKQDTLNSLFCYLRCKVIRNCLAWTVSQLSKSYLELICPSKQW